MIGCLYSYYLFLVCEFFKIIDCVLIMLKWNGVFCLGFKIGEKFRYFYGFKSIELFFYSLNYLFFLEYFIIV